MMPTTPPRRRPLRAALLLAPLVLALVLPAARAHAQGGGLVLYENGAPDIGSAHAGAGARAEDAATAFTNPAGMTRLHENHLLLGTMAIFSDIELDLGAGTVSSPPGSFDGGGNIGSFAPGLGSFIVMPLGEKLRFGFSVTALAANGVDYDDNWVGRAFVTENSIVVANFEPALAYRVNDWLSVGAGLNILYMQLNQDIKASNAADAPTIKIDEADDWEPAVTLSLLLEPSERTRIGLNYRTEAEFDLDGDLQVPIPGSLTFNGDFTLPQGFNVSLYHELNDRLAILADGGWSDWSAFGQIPTQFGPVPVLQDRGWDDTWRAAVGLQYRIDDQWLVRGGFGFDSSPLDDDKVLPDIPVGAQYRFSLGLQKNFGQGKVFGIGYTLMYTDIEIDGVPLPPNNAVVLDGEYDPAFIHVLGTYLSLTF